MTADQKRATCPACGNAVEALPQGRPSDLTPALAQRMAALISDGYSKVSTCRKVGVPERTFYDWQRRAREGTEPYATLMWEVARAEEDYIHKIEMEVRDGRNLRGGADPAARVAFLKSRREEWTTRVKLEAAREQVLQELLDGLREQFSAKLEIYYEHVAPALLTIAGVAPVPPSVQLDFSDDAPLSEEVD